MRTFLPWQQSNNLFANLTYERTISIPRCGCPFRRGPEAEKARNFTSPAQSSRQRRSTARPHSLVHSYSPPLQPYHPSPTVFHAFDHAPSQLRGALTHLIQALQRASDNVERSRQQATEEAWAAYIFFTVLRREALQSTDSAARLRYVLPRSVLSSLWWCMASRADSEDQKRIERFLSRLLILRSRESLNGDLSGDDDDFGWSIAALSAESERREVSIGLPTCKASHKLAPLWVHKLVHMRLQSTHPDTPAKLLDWLDRLRSRLHTRTDTVRDFLGTLHTSLVNGVISALIHHQAWNDVQALVFEQSETSTPRFSTDITSPSARARFTSFAVWLNAVQPLLQSQHWSDQGTFSTTMRILTELVTLHDLAHARVHELEELFDSGTFDGQKQEETARTMRKLRLDMEKTRKSIEKWLNAAVQARRHAPRIAAVLSDARRLHSGPEAYQAAVVALDEVFYPHRAPEAIASSLVVPWLAVLARDHACASPSSHTLRTALETDATDYRSLSFDSIAHLGDATLCAHLHHATSFPTSSTHALKAAHLWLDLRARYIPLRKSLLAGVVLALQRSVRARKVGLAGKRNVLRAQGIQDVQAQRGQKQTHYGPAVPRAVRGRRRLLSKTFRATRNALLSDQRLTSARLRIPTQTKLHQDVVRSVTLNLLAQSPTLDATEVQRSTFRRLLQLHAELEDYRFTKRLWSIWMLGEAKCTGDNAAGRAVKQLPLPLYHCRWLFAAAIFYANQLPFASRLYEDFKIGQLPRVSQDSLQNLHRSAQATTTRASLTPALMVHYLKALESYSMTGLSSRVLSDLTRQQVHVPDALARELVAAFAQKGEEGAEQALEMATMVQGAWRAAALQSGQRDKQSRRPPPLEMYALALDAASRAFVGWSEERDARTWRLWSSFRKALVETLSLRKEACASKEPRRIMIATDTILRAYCAAMRMCVGEPRTELQWDAPHFSPLSTAGYIHPRTREERMAVLSALIAELRNNLGVALDSAAYGLLILAHIVRTPLTEPGRRGSTNDKDLYAATTLGSFDRSFATAPHASPRRRVNTSGTRDDASLNGALAWFGESKAVRFARLCELSNKAALSSISPLEATSHPLGVLAPVPQGHSSRFDTEAELRGSVRPVRVKSGIAGRLLLALARAGRFEDGHAMYADWCKREWEGFVKHRREALFGHRRRNDFGHRFSTMGGDEAAQPKLITEAAALPAAFDPRGLSTPLVGPSGLPLPPRIAHSSGVRGSLIHLLVHSGEERHAFEELRTMLRDEAYFMTGQWKADLAAVLAEMREREGGSDNEGDRRRVGAQEWRSVGIDIRGEKK